jgi:hypothetical protein
LTPFVGKPQPVRWALAQREVFSEHQAKAKQLQHLTEVHDWTGPTRQAMTPEAESAPVDSGIIVSVRGSVVDVRLDACLPPIWTVLRAGLERQIVMGDGHHRPFSADRRPGHLPEAAVLGQAHRAQAICQRAWPGHAGNS